MWNTNAIFLNTVQNQLFSCVKSCNQYWWFSSAPTSTLLYTDTLRDRSTATQPLTVQKFHCLSAEDDGGYQLHTAGRKYVLCATSGKFSFQIHLQKKLLTFLFSCLVLNTERPIITSNSFLTIISIYGRHGCEINVHIYLSN